MRAGCVRHMAQPARFITRISAARMEMQTPMNTAKSFTDIEQHLKELELELLRPDVRRSPELLSSLLAEDFREFGSSGRIFGRNEIVQVLQTESLSQFSISEFRAKIVGDGIALVTYRVTQRRESDTSETVSLRSSLWVRQDSQWHMLFHQGTKVPAP